MKNVVTKTFDNIFEHRKLLFVDDFSGGSLGITRGGWPYKPISVYAVLQHIIIYCSEHTIYYTVARAPQRSYRGSAQECLAATPFRRWRRRVGRIDLFPVFYHIVDARPAGAHAPYNTWKRFFKSPSPAPPIRIQGDSFIEEPSFQNLVFTTFIVIIIFLSFSFFSYDSMDF